MKKFIPKLKDRSLTEISFDEFYVDADVVEGKHKVFAEVSAEVNTYTIDPRTNRLPYNSSKSMEKLPYYFPKEDFDEILADSSRRLKDLIIPSVDYQIEKGSQHVIPPYFYSEDVTSQIFNVNIENITNVIKYQEEMDTDFSIYPAINVSNNILSSENLLRYVVSSYTSDEFIDYIDGFYVMIDSLEASQASEDDLLGLLQLVKALSKKDVRVVAINAFGYASLLLGASSIISGLASNEYTSVETWKMSKEERSNIRPRGSSFMYMPDIFTYIDEVELRKMSYVCSCDYCNSSLPQKPVDKKRHFLTCRQRDIENLFTGNFEKDLGALKTFYLEGKKFAISMLNKRQTTRKNDVILFPINRWLNVLDRADEIERQEGAENLLKQILDDIDQHDKDSN